MHNLTLRRYAAYAGVVLAAVASVATSGSQPTSSRSGDDELSTESTEVVHHFTVHADRDHSLGASADIAWDGVADGSQAEVLVRITGDGASQSHEQTLRFADFVAGGRAPSAARGQVSAGLHCGSSSCDQGYTLLFRLLKSAPGEHTAVHWAVKAQLLDQSSESSISVDED